MSAACPASQPAAPVVSAPPVSPARPVSGPPVSGPPVSAPPAPPVSTAPMASAALELLDRAGASLLHASHSGDAGDRYIAAHLGALRAAAAILAARTSPTRPSRPRSVWELLPALAPELTEWAIFFAASGRRRAAIERGDHDLAAREADDLLRQAEVFLGIVHDLLGVPRSVPLPTYLTPVTTIRHGRAR